MKKYWETINGDEIEYKKLENNHLLNILKWIERRGWSVEKTLEEPINIKNSH